MIYVVLLFTKTHNNSDICCVVFYKNTIIVIYVVLLFTKTHNNSDICCVVVYKNT